MADHRAKIMIRVHPEDVRQVIQLARLSVETGKVSELDEEFDHAAAIGALNKALEDAEAKVAS